MPICCICQMCITDLSLFRRHFRSHNLSTNKKIRCAEKKCGGTFSNLSNFLRHFRSHHSCKQEDCLINPDYTSLDDFVDTDEKKEVSENTEKEQNDHSQEFNVNLEFVQSFICKLYTDITIPRNKIQDIQDYTQILFSDSLTRLRGEIEKIISNENSLVDKQLDLEKIFSNVTEPFNLLKTEYRRFKFFEAQGTFTRPMSIPLHYDFKPHSTQSGFYLENSPISIQLIPLRCVLKSFLEQPLVYVNISEYIRQVSLQKEVLSDFMQGTLWRETAQNISTQSSDDNSLDWPLFLFVDDYECGNALGSHEGENKICAVYVSLAVLPPEFRSILNNIFLFGLFYSSDRLTMPNSRLYKPFYDELMFLSTTGIDIVTPEFTGKIRFHLSLILGDNLGLHQITDFVGCFTANFPCRFCQCHREVIRLQVKEDPKEIRNIKNYESDLLKNDRSQTGINENSLWNGLPNFHVTENVAVDVMHDVLEGICVLDLLTILNFGFQHNYMKIDEVNNRIINFNYGVVAKRNKPPPLKPTQAKKVSIKMSSAEMFNFVIFFGILIGKYFPEEDPIWNLYVLLRQIMDIVFSPYVNFHGINRLEELITQHHRVYLAWSEARRLTPKFHHLLHYPRLIKKMGPLIHLWGMRYEAKHQQGKRIAASITSTRNVPFTVALRLQILQHCYLQSDNALANRLESGRISVILPKDLPFLSSCQNVPPDLDKSWELASWVSVSGTRYQTEMVLVLPNEDLDPSFGIIKAICLHSNGDVGFFCQNLRTLFFDSHVHCHQVQLASTDFSFIKQSDLTHFLPTSIASDSFGNLFVPYKYGI